MLSSARAALLVTPRLALQSQTRSLTLTLRKMDEAMAHLKANPFYEQYRDKIDKIKEKQPEALVKAVEGRKAEAASQASDATAAAAGVRKVSQPAGAGKRRLTPSDYSGRPQKRLQDLMKVELLSPLSAQEVTTLWTKYWTSRPAVCGVVPVDAYKGIKATASIYNKFLLPLPRETGYEFVFTQFHGDEFHITTLANYQAHQENAPECLSLVHYTELAAKDIVLMCGEYDTKVLSATEAQYLANQLQLYYSGRNSAKLALVRGFNMAPQTFDHTLLIKDLESLAVDVQPTKTKV